MAEVNKGQELGEKVYYPAEKAHYLDSNNGQMNFEKPSDFGKWSKIGSDDGDSIAFNSSHTYPLAIEDYISNVKLLMENERPGVLSIEIRPTNRCNYNCIGCFSSKVRKNKTKIDSDRLSDLLDECSDVGVKVLRFAGGGEPLLHENTVQMIEKACLDNMGTVLITNGGLLYKINQPQLVENLNFLRVSINGGKNSYHLIHGCAHEEFMRIIHSLEQISDQREKLNKQDELYIAATYLVHPKNILDISDTARLLKEIGLDAVYFRALNDHKGFYGSDLEILRSEISKSLELIGDDYFIHFAGRLTDPEANPNTNRGYCYSGQFRLYLEADGSLSICGRYSGTDKFQLGNIKNDSLVSILEDNPVINKIRDSAAMDCNGCDCVYFNKAMQFIHDKIRGNPETNFFRIFDR